MLKLKNYLLLLTIAIPMTALANLIPSDNHSVYYQIGGGADIPMPAMYETNTVPLSVSGNIGLGYNCGVFNPILSITNSLNNIKSSFQNMSHTVVDNATAAVAEFPMYELARANPTLYDLFNNGLLGAREDLNVSTKSCQVMQNEIASGQNPYTDWGTISIGDDWKYHMSMAGSGANDENDNDINQVKDSVQHDNGKNGVSWVQGSRSATGLRAGGEGQPAIEVINDTVIAGYNTLLQNNREPDDTSAPLRSDKNARLVDTWQDPKQAATWITQVVGDVKITTFNQGEKSSTPGVGLLPDNQIDAQTIQDQLTDLVMNHTMITVEHLKAVSSPQVMMSPAIIQALQQQTPVMRTIYIHKLAEQAAAARTIEKAYLARRLLVSGSQVPAIYSNKAAQETIDTSIKRLDQSINSLLQYVTINKTLVSNVASTLLTVTKESALGNASLQASVLSDKTLENGAKESSDDDNNATQGVLP